MSSFDGYFYKYHGSEKGKKEFKIGGCESAFLVELVASYLFEKSNTLLNLTNYHVIYHDHGLVVFKVKKSIQ